MLTNMHNPQKELIFEKIKWYIFENEVVESAKEKVMTTKPKIIADTVNIWGTLILGIVWHPLIGNG